MGYCISLRDSSFRVPSDKKAAALGALRAMWQRAGGRAGHYAWMNGTSLSRGDCPTFEHGMAEWGYPVEVDDAGNVVGLSLANEKVGDEEAMFTAIAPFVDAGSYLEIGGEDGEVWRWAFDGSTVRTLAAVVSFEATD